MQNPALVNTFHKIFFTVNILLTIRVTGRGGLFQRYLFQVADLGYTVSITKI
jgi:hypothetical protein